MELTDDERQAIYERLAGFCWEPRWLATGKCLVRRKGKLVTVRRSEVKGRWFVQGRVKIYEGEDYGNEVVGESSSLTEYLQLLDRYYVALQLPQIEDDRYPREEALRSINQRMDVLYPDADLPEAVENRIREHQNQHYQKLIDCVSTHERK